MQLRSLLIFSGNVVTERKRTGASKRAEDFSFIEALRQDVASSMEALQLEFQVFSISEAYRRGSEVKAKHREVRKRYYGISNVQSEHFFAHDVASANTVASFACHSSSKSRSRSKRF